MAEWSETAVKKLAVFRVPKGTVGFPLERAAKEAVAKFFRRLEKTNWRYEGSMAIRKLDVIERAEDETFTQVGEKKGVGIWLPNRSGLRPAHPAYKPGVDHYELSIMCREKKIERRIEVSDRLVGSLPAGVTVT